MGDNGIVLSRLSAITLAAVMTAALAAHGGEPGSFRPGLFLGEAGAGAATSLTPVLLGSSIISKGAYGYEEDETGKGFWPGAIVMGSYPFTMTLGTMGVGEKVGAPSSNPGTVYLVPTAASLALAAASAAVGNEIFGDYDKGSRVALGILYGVVPNAFLNAYVYNRVKKSKADAASSRISAAPYVTACRGGRGAPTPVYGLTLSF